jgi:hypothetical protein
MTHQPASLMITKGFRSPETKNPSRSWKTPFPVSLTRGVTVALGLLTVAWPLAWAPGLAYAVAVAGALAVLGAALAGWRHGPALAVAAAIASSAFSRAGTAVLAAEGLFILCYLIAADAPPGLTPRTPTTPTTPTTPRSPGARPARWLRHQVRLAVAGLIGSGAVLAALALHRESGAWLTAAGLAAAVAAYLIALPRTPA